MLYIKNNDGALTPISFDSHDLDFLVKCQVCGKEILLSGRDVYEEIRDTIEYDTGIATFNKNNCSAACRDKQKKIQFIKSRV